VSARGIVVTPRDPCFRRKLELPGLIACRVVLIKASGSPRLTRQPDKRRRAQLELALRRERQVRGRPFIRQRYLDWFGFELRSASDQPVTFGDISQDVEDWYVSLHVLFGKSHSHGSQSFRRGPGRQPHALDTCHLPFLFVTGPHRSKRRRSVRRHWKSRTAETWKPCRLFARAAASEAPGESTRAASAQTVRMVGTSKTHCGQVWRRRRHHVSKRRRLPNKLAATATTLHD